MSKAKNSASGKKEESLGDFIRQCLIIIVGVFFIRSLLIEPFNIPSGSMIPTLQIGDFVAVSKYSYGYSRYSFPFSLPLFEGRIFGSTPHRGDVAVFRYTQDTSIDYIKRVIGLPGDHIRLEDGKLYINDREVPRDNLGHYAVNDENDRLLSGTRYLENLPREDGKKIVKHEILKMREDDEANNTKEYVVPAGCLFMMGDDRDDSADSRFQGGRETGKCAAPAGNDFLKATDKDLGFVPTENLIGRAQRVMFSIDLKHPSWAFWYWPTEIRWGRTFHGIN
ncbi:signal peptidase I [Aristophania vespae]|uniref:Signal peptidase I n=1 Tax=Aristophania vespae TaxID=2697033 RepID=A0A6P1NI53_9PROT|nr:signal peptidase I [Aristophania vespae]QHI95332.1 signal peptidase I [Aristophania vespae]